MNIILILLRWLEKLIDFFQWVTGVKGPMIY